MIHYDKAENQEEKITVISPILNNNAVFHDNNSIEAELLWVTIKVNPMSSWLFGVCYRPEVDEDYMLPKIITSVNNIDNQNVYGTDDIDQDNHYQDGDDKHMII